MEVGFTKMTTTTATSQKRLWQIDDGEYYWIMAPTPVEALQLWEDLCSDGSDMEIGELGIREVTDRAHTIAIRDDDEQGGPPRSAKMWMDLVSEPYVAIIGTSAW